jgi:hypothetical protein
MTGCYVPTPVVHTTLHIAVDGQYEIEGRPVASKDLVATLLAIKPAGQNLVVQIQVVPGASGTSIRGAVNAVETAQARVAFSDASVAP